MVRRDRGGSGDAAVSKPNVQAGDLVGSFPALSVQLVQQPRRQRGWWTRIFWFYVKNIGVPYLLILLALFQRKRKYPEALNPEADGGELSGGSAGPDVKAIDRHNAWVRQYRLIAAGAFLILLIAEFIIFQPNEYDNNKLIYVWFLLLVPMAADYAMTLYRKMKSVGGRRIIAALFLIACFLSAGLTVARECVSNYQAYTVEDVAAAEFVKENTPEHCVFITGTQHLNPVASLAGRTIVNGSDLYLYFHGFNTTQRKAELKAFYEDPAGNLDLLTRIRRGLYLRERLGTFLLRRGYGRARQPVYTGVRKRAGRHRDLERRAWHAGYAVMDAFLKYSLEKQQKIRVVLLVDGVISQKNAVVLALTDSEATLRLSTKKEPVTVKLIDILSCDYARGDHGEED